MAASPAGDAQQRTSPRPAFAEDGRFVLEQETNAYAVLPESQWPGYPPATGAASALAWHVGRTDAPALVQAALEGDLAGKVHVLASDPKDGLAAALARLGRAFMGRDS
jgi:hypothetical protein